MAVLKNQRHERFAQLVATGKSGASAYGEIYGRKGGVAEACASRLLRNQKIMDRVAELQGEAAKGAVLTIEQMHDFLLRVVLTPIANVDETSDLCQSWEYSMSGGPRGKLRRGNADSGNEEESEERTTVKVKVPDKLKAIELAAKLQGLLTEKREVEVSGKLATPIELSERVETVSPLLGKLMGK